jgi:cysteine-rich repeat protein
VAPLPDGGRAIYGQESAAMVAHFDEGFGQVVFLGWDWFDAAPLGPVDGGWLGVLDAAVRQVANRCGNGALDPGERCDDGNQASGDCCSATCDFEAAGAACQGDGNACTPDTCNGAGTCVHGAPCDDGNSCTDDLCTAGYCSNTVRTGPCDDGNACTSGDTCESGVCAGAGVSCDDGNSCTTDACDPATGCQNVPLAAGSACDDRDACGPDACNASAQCVPVFKKACESTSAHQKGRFGVVMEWKPEVATPGVDFCVGQVVLNEPGGSEQPASNEVQDVVSIRTHRAVLKMKLNRAGRALVQSVPRGNVVSVALRMDIHKADGSASQIRLIQLLKRRK